MVGVTFMSPQWLTNPGCAQGLRLVSRDATNYSEDAQQGMLGSILVTFLPIYPIVWFFQESLVLKLLREVSTQVSVNPSPSSSRRRDTHLYTQPTVSRLGRGLCFPNLAQCLAHGVCLLHIYGRKEGGPSDFHSDFHFPSTSAVLRVVLSHACVPGVE